MELMARKNSRVPVANRTQRNASKVRTLPHIRLTIVEVAALVFVLILLIALIGTPLRNYLQQRAEIGRIESDIVAMQEEKDNLLEEIDRYKSDAYVRELARTRLGVIAEGETAFRVMDDRLQNSRQTSDMDNTDEQESGPWYEMLWKSVTVEDAVEPETADDHRHDLPIKPTETPEVPAPVDAPSEPDAGEAQAPASAEAPQQ